MLVFDKIKQVITHAFVLVSPNPSHPFNLFSYATKETIAIVISQKNIEGHENPIAFMSIILKGVKLNYILLENILML